MIRSMPRNRLRLLVVLYGAALLLLLVTPLVGGPARAQAPSPDQVRTQAPAPIDVPASALVEVGITDRVGVLSDGDHDLLRAETERIDFPPQVRRVEYLLFDDIL